MLFQIIHLVLRLIDNAYISSQQPYIKLNENVSNQKRTNDIRDLQWVYNS